MRNFVAVDGEGINDKYVLLACSSGQYVQSVNGLGTKECFEFLLNLNMAPRSTLVGFFFTYDVNMILIDIPLPKLRKLWAEKWLYWQGYILEWTPTKSFTIKRESPKRRVTVYDVGGFFQSSFVKALRNWKAAPEEVIERIESMKDQRDDFSEELLPSMRTYCLEECEYLVSLMGKLQVALHTADCTPNTWQGAGSIAGKLLQKNKVKLYRQPDTTWGEEIHEAILRSYFGGRVELFCQGNFEDACAYDVTSAYPYAATLVPSLQGRFHSVTGVPNGFGLCRVRWKIDSDSIVTPFPFRLKKGIYWPTKGEGYYHAVEVREAIKVYGSQIEILEGWEFESETDYKPFGFIQEAFQARAEFKRQGNPAEKAIKLGLNAMYGKLAQGIGWRGKPPAHRSYLWAGFLTAHCRATMFRLASQVPDKVIMIATDGIFLSDNPNWETEEGKLGALTTSEYETLFTAQPGVYCDKSGAINKTRGFSLKEITFDSLQEGFSKRGPFHVSHYSSRRFQGLGTSLQRKTMEGWRTWPESQRKLSLFPSRKWIREYQDPSEWKDNPQPYVRHYPPTCEGLSERYEPKTPDLDLPLTLELAELNEQPDPGEAYHQK